MVLAAPSARGVKAVRVLGSPKRARDVVQALLWEGLERRGFSRRIEDEARDAPAGAAEVDPTRRDLRDLATFTVDPATARDFDDAVSAEADGDGVRLWIHIADVSAHVRPGSALDAEAYTARDQRLRAGHRRADAARARSPTRRAAWCRTRIASP